MKKLLVLLGIMIGFTIGADVKPFVFENVDTTHDVQQAEFEYMLKYKLFGRDYITIGNDVVIKDESGWNGTAGYMTSKDRLTLGGPVLVNGTITNGDQPTLTSGPVRAQTYTYRNQNNACINGLVCLDDVSNSKVNHCETGMIYNSSSEICADNVPPAPKNLTIPTITWPDTISQSIIFDSQLNGDIKTIVVPDGSDQYDIYLDTIQFKLDHQKLQIEMQDGGRLTRIFVKHFLYHDHGQIQVVYRTDSTNYALTQKDYRGNVIIYTDESISIEHSDNSIMQGTMISTKEIYLACNINFAGQLLANQLRIGDTYKGDHFRFVKFDPDTIDVKLDKYGGLRENDSTVVIPIELSDTTDINVYFTYCIELNDGVTIDDFNIPPSFPICNNGESKKVSIPTGSKTSNIPIQINVKVDTLTEPNDILVLKITDISGAILPNGKTDGELKIKIIDATHSPLAFDTTAVYTFDENKTGVVDLIKVLNKTETTRFKLDSGYTNRYKLDSLTGELELVSNPLDYELSIIDTIKVTLTDTGNVSITRYIPISVNDVNEAPVLNDTTLYLSENLPIPSIIGVLKATDEDIRSEFRNNVFKIVSGDTNTFKIDPASGRITAGKIFNYETDDSVFTLKVKVMDKTDTTLCDSAIVTIKIFDTNEGPKFATDDTTLVVKENVPAGIIGSIPATDEDGDSITYIIVGNVPFTVDSVGNISSTREFDYETETGFQFKLVATDGTITDTVKINVKIENVNEPLTVKDTTFTIPEDSVGVIGKIDGVDEDGDDIKYNISDSSNYVIDDNGVLSIKEPFDYEKQQFDTLYVYATDGEFTDTAIVIIKIENINEPPVLQPNDSLRVEENCDTCTVGVITAIDPDIDDKIIYEVIESGFTIDSTGTLKTTEPIDYETTKEIIVTVIAKDTSGASDTLKYTVKIDDVNEPVHVKDTTCTIKENYTGNVCKIHANDDDGTIPTYIVTDTINYSIDSTGQLVIKKPIDFENKPIDTVTVIVSDGVFYDTAQVIIKIEDVPEQTKITEVDDKPKQDTIKTNNPDHKIEWEICEGKSCILDSIDVIVNKDTTIRVCNEKKTSCDEVVILFNDVPPVVTLTNAKSTDTWIDYITIEEQKDDKIYVNKKENPITVIVKDTVRNTTKTFDISVKLDTLSSKDIKLNEYNYVIDEMKANIIPIGDNKAEIVEIINDDGVEITIKKIVDLKSMIPVDTIQTVSYTKTINGKDVVISYKTDNLTGQRLTDYTISYMIDSCTSVSYTMNDNKQIVKNNEGNIAYTISYDYVDDFGNKATASVDIIYDDIPPKVEILSPYNNDIFNTNAVKIKWTVNGEVQDTLTLQRLEKGVNLIIRRYVDKAGNEACDTVRIIMKEAKDIDVSIIHPVTEINQDKVDQYYADGNEYNPKKPFTIKITDPKSDSIPEPIGIGFKIDIALPSVSPNGGLASLNDLVKNGQIPVDDKGNIVGASTKGIPVDKYVEEHCTAEFQEDYHTKGLNIPLYDVKYQLHLWVWTTTAGYVNDFIVEYTLNDEDEATEAGTVQMVLDWLADKNGAVNASNGKQLGTSSYITKLYSKSVAKHRCDYKEQRKGEKTVKKTETTKIFGYKRPKK